MMSITTFCFGLLFGNLNSLAMEPFGRLAGLASGTIGALNMIIGVLAGSVIGMSFNGTLIPMLAGFAVCSFVSLLLIRFATAHPITEDVQSEVSAAN
jgi:DHA1 family bicyclomycin/chloramphenicol resistance-like MFS transporter